MTVAGRVLPPGRCALSRRASPARRHQGAAHPGLRVLLTSGFVGEGRVIEGREFPLLDKPYEAAVLSSTLRKLLDRPERKSRRRAAAPAE